MLGRIVVNHCDAVFRIVVRINVERGHVRPDIQQHRVIPVVKVDPRNPGVNHFRQQRFQVSVGAVENREQRPIFVGVSVQLQGLYPWLDALHAVEVQAESGEAQREEDHEVEFLQISDDSQRSQL